MALSQRSSTATTGRVPLCPTIRLVVVNTSAV